MKVRRSWRKKLLPLPRGERDGVRGFGSSRKNSTIRTPSTCPSPPSARLRASSTRYGGEGTQRRARVAHLSSKRMQTKNGDGRNARPRGSVRRRRLETNSAGGVDLTRHSRVAELVTHALPSGNA